MPTFQSNFDRGYSSDGKLSANVIWSDGIDQIYFQNFGLRFWGVTKWHLMEPLEVRFSYDLYYRVVRLVSGESGVYLKCGHGVASEAHFELLKSDKKLKLSYMKIEIVIIENFEEALIKMMNLMELQIFYFK